MHQVAVSRSETLKGVYEPCPYNPIMTQRDYDAPITCCGHGKPVENSKPRMVYGISVQQTARRRVWNFGQRDMSRPGDMDRRRLAYR